MIIGIDLRPLQGLHRYRGIGVYISRLVQAISRLNHDDRFVLFMFSPYQEDIEQLRLDPKFNYEVRVVDTVVKNETVYKFLSSWRILVPFKTDDLDVFLQPDIAFGVAPSGIPMVSVFYDSILTMYRSHHLDRSILKVIKSEGLKTGLAYLMNRRVYLKSTRRYLRSSQILSISQSSKNDLLNMIDYPEQKVVVTPLATTDEYHEYSEAQISKTLTALKITRPYVLYIGGADYRKNVTDALDAFSIALAEYSDLKLVLVGRDFEPNKLRENKELQAKISALSSSANCVGFGKDKDLPRLYAGAKAFLFPSLYEGFGIPILEAMRSNCPVVAYSNSSVPEIVQGSFELANTKDQYQAILLKVLSDATYRKRIIPAARKVSAAFSWDLTANLTLQSIRQVIDENTC